MTAKQREVYLLMAKYPDRVIVEDECAHSGDKVRHHHDYGKPFNVVLLCGFCHAAIHFPMNNKVKSKLQIHRESIGMSKSELAVMANLNQSIITRWERGEKISLKNIAKIAFALNLTPSDLL